MAQVQICKPDMRGILSLLGNHTLPFPWVLHKPCSSCYIPCTCQFHSHSHNPKTHLHLSPPSRTPAQSFRTNSPLTFSWASKEDSFCLLGASLAFLQLPRYRVHSQLETVHASVFPEVGDPSQELWNLFLVFFSKIIEGKFNINAL